ADASIAQAVMYEQIRNHPSVVELYRKRLADAGVLDGDALERLRTARREKLDEALETARREKPRQKVLAFGGVWTGLGWAGDDWSADTRVPAERLREIGEALRRLPDDFTPHPRVAKLLDARVERVRQG